MPAMRAAVAGSTLAAVASSFARRTSGGWDGTNTCDAASVPPPSLRETVFAAVWAEEPPVSEPVARSALPQAPPLATTATISVIVILCRIWSMGFTGRAGNAIANPTGPSSHLTRPGYNLASAVDVRRKNLLQGNTAGQVFVRAMPAGPDTKLAPATIESTRSCGTPARSPWKHWRKVRWSPVTAAKPLTALTHNRRASG